MMKMTYAVFDDTDCKQEDVREYVYTNGEQTIAVRTSTQGIADGLIANLERKGWKYLGEDLCPSVVEKASLRGSIDVLDWFDKVLTDGEKVTVWQDKELPRERCSQFTFGNNIIFTQYKEVAELLAKKLGEKIPEEKVDAVTCVRNGVRETVDPNGQKQRKTRTQTSLFD